MEKKPAHQGATGHAAAGMLLIWLLLYNITGAIAQVIVPYQSDWKYLQNGVVQTNSSWAATGFSDASWSGGKAPFGFGSNPGYSYNTTLTRGKDNVVPNYPVFYFRRSFQVSNASAYSRLRLRATLDDGIVIYIGGVEVARKNMTPSQSGFAGSPVGTPLLTIDTLISANYLQNGTNVIAVELHQTGDMSSDIYFDVQLEAQTTTLFRYPYLQLASHNRMSVYWYTNVPTNAVVRYSTNPDLEIYKEVKSTINDTLHSVALLNLSPDTRYYYSVGYYIGTEYRQLQYNPAVNYFRTLHDPADTTRSVRFWLLGDSGAGKNYNPRPYKVRDAYLAYLASKNNPKVDGMIFLGDNSNTAPYEGLQIALDTTLFKFYNRPNDQQLLSHIPSWTVIGNHDYEPDLTYINKSGKPLWVRKAYHKQTAASFSAFAYPDSAQIGGEPTYNKQGYYSFDQGNVHIVVLNPPLIESQNVAENWERKFQGTSYFDLFSKNSIASDDSTNSAIDLLPQVKWLVKDLQNNKKKWTLVTFHLPPFSTIGHFLNEKDLLRVQEKLLPILEKPEYHVDALVVSHSHAYERAGMIRKKGSAARTADYTQTGGLAGNGNLGRYPATRPYTKINSETAYTYILSGSAGRGWYNTGNVNENDGGYPPPTTATVLHPSTSVPPLDNLTGDNTTDFYYMKGGSVELVFQENRLDVKFIKESDVSPKFVVADSFVVMKDVSKKKTMTIANGGDAVKLTASWIGNYNWYIAQQPGLLLATGVRSLSIGPGSSSTFYVRDQNGYLADTFIVNVTNPKPVIVGDTLIPFRAQWLLPLMAGSASRDVKLEKRCTDPWSFDAPTFEQPSRAIIGLGHNDEGYPLGNYNIERIMYAAERLWFRRSFILNGSAQTYAGFKLTVLRDKDLPTRKSYRAVDHLILINGQPVDATTVTRKDVANGREEVTYMLSNKGFVYGINYVLISYYIYPMNSSPINAATDPFTFDAQLISMPLGLAPPPSTRQFKLGTVAMSPQVCAGDTASVRFAAAGNESGFPVIYEARLVTDSGDLAIGEGTTSPILGQIPAGLAEGKYKLRIATKNAFMDDLEGPETIVHTLPSATILPAPAVTVWKGEPVTLPVRFEGTGPWQYVTPDGKEGTSAVADTTIRVKATASGPYALRSVTNRCGAGKVTGKVEAAVKEPILTVSKVAQLTSAPLKTAVCDGDSLAVSFSVTGPDRTRTYSAELSDATGSFAKPLLLGNGAGSPLLARLPGALAGADQYRIRITAVDPDVDFTLNQSGAQAIRSRAEGNFTLSKEAVYEGEKLQLALVVKGSLPAYYYLRYGADTLQGNTSQPMVERLLTLHQTTAFSLDSVRNVCGYGTVTGNRSVTVSLVVGVDPLSGNGITAYPNPASETLLLRGKANWREPFQWHVYGADGKLFQAGTGMPSAESSFEIDTRRLPSGLYILKLNRGKQENSWKIIKN